MKTHFSVTALIFAVLAALFLIFTPAANAATQSYSTIDATTNGAKSHCSLHTDYNKVYTLPFRAIFSCQVTDTKTTDGHPVYVEWWTSNSSHHKETRGNSKYFEFTSANDSKTKPSKVYYKVCVNDDWNDTCSSTKSWTVK